MMCGPFMAATMNGIIRNGPTPTMLMMLVAEAWSRPMPRTSDGGDTACPPSSRTPGVLDIQCLDQRRHAIGSGRERVQRQRADRIDARAAERGGDCRALVGLDPDDQRFAVCGHGRDVQRTRTVAIDH